MNDREEHWLHLLSTARLGKAHSPEPSSRSEYQRDFDRIIFSSALRRMQDKTQVFPLARNDYVRTRLTHSLEVSSVGRSMGAGVGHVLLQRYPALQQKHYSEDIANIVAAACLAHDIGNPPFGHFGETAIRDYFQSATAAPIMRCLTPEEGKDLRHFEGNAQSFRILSRLQNPECEGGMRLTAATLGATAKYPWIYQNNCPPYRKSGVYLEDLELFRRTFAELHLPEQSPNIWQRHPLSYLMEASDDICYLIVDIEDAYQVGEIEFKQAQDLLRDIAADYADPHRINATHSRSDTLSYLRAKAIGKMVSEVISVFLDGEEDMLQRSPLPPLLKNAPSYAKLEALRDYATANIYSCRPVVEIQMAGHRILSGLLALFSESIFRNHPTQNCASHYDHMLLSLLPERFYPQDASLYAQMLAVCDYVSGMTDSYAVSLYKKLTGISLPVS